LIGNAAYGLVTQGMGNVDKFSIAKGDTERLSGSEYSNPIIASYTTAGARCVLGETIDNLNHIKGALVVSCTTDVFITNIPDVENTILRESKT
jgi:aminopeptidase-like protein